MILYVFLTHQKNINNCYQRIKDMMIDDFVIVNGGFIYSDIVNKYPKVSADLVDNDKDGTHKKSNIYHFIYFNFHIIRLYIILVEELIGDKYLGRFRVSLNSFYFRFLSNLLGLYHPNSDLFAHQTTFWEILPFYSYFYLTKLPTS